MGKNHAKNTKFQNVRPLIRKNVSTKRKNIVKRPTKRNVHMRRKKNVKPYTEPKQLTKRNKNVTPPIKKNASQTIIMARNVQRSQKKNAPTRMYPNTTRFPKR